jgi:hypothetical protein
MTDVSIRTERPSGQGDADDDRFLGEMQPATYVRLTLSERGDGAVLWRHRNPGNSKPDPDPAARITRVDGVTVIDWDDWHRKYRPVWMPAAEDWVRETLEEAS